MRQRRQGHAAIRLAGAMAVALMAVSAGLSAGAQAGSERIAAWVNGEYITEGEFFDRIQRMRAQDFIVSVNPLSLRSDSAGKLMLNTLILERLILQFAAKTNQMPTEAKVSAEFEEIKAQPNVAKALADKTLSEELIKQQIRVNRARFNLATTAASVSPQDVEAWYKAHITRFTTPERWKLAMIRTAKQDDLAKIQADLKAGKPFAEAAKTYSDDAGSRERGGDIGIRPANDPNLPAPLKEALRKMKPGEVTPPLKMEANAPQGQPRPVFWFVFQLISREPEVVRPLDQVKEVAEEAALLERAGGVQVADKKIAQFREQSTIKVNLPAYQELAEKKQDAD